MRVGKPAVLKYLQEQIENVRVGFFYFIEKNDAVRSFANAFRKRSAVVIADVSRRRSNQLCDAVLFHIFRHIKAQKRLFRPEKRLRKCLCKLRFADASRSCEYKRANRSVRI